MGTLAKGPIFAARRQQVSDLSGGDWAGFLQALESYCEREGTKRPDALKVAAASLKPPPARGEGANLALREANHRVKNELQTLISFMRWRSRAARTPEHKAACAGCLLQTMSFTRLHDLLGPDPTGRSVDLSDYLGSLCQLFGSSMGIGSRISITRDLATIYATSPVASQIGLIVNEALINAVKHAFPDGRTGWINVRLRPCAGAKSRLTVTDNGVGLRNGGSQRSGLKLIESIAAQLGGRIELSDVEPGLRLSCIFSLREDVSSKAPMA